MGQKIEKYFWEEKENLFDMEKKVVKNHRRLNFYHQILMSPPTIFKLGPKDDFSQPRKSLFKRNTKDIEGV